MLNLDKASGLRSNLRRWVRTGLREAGVQSVTRVINGRKFRIPLEYTNLRTILPWHRAEDIEGNFAYAVLERVRPGAHVVDVGAHIGKFTLLFADQVGPSGRVLAFEPNPSNYRAVELSVKCNGFRNVLFDSRAVGSERGRLPLILNGEESRLGSSAQAGSASIEVEVAPLDELVRSHDIEPEVLKIDVEGFEQKVLSGAQRVLERLKVLSLEVHPRKMKEVGDDADELLKDLERRGFRVTFRHNPPKHLADSSRPFNVILERTS